MNHTRRAILIIPILLLTFLDASAQPGTISFIHYTTDNGLSHDEVNYIWKDRDGFMCFGTASGLNRFDGREFKIYLHQPDKRSVPAKSPASKPAPGGTRRCTTTFYPIESFARDSLD
ncbi:MAG: hypothetical protein SFU99_01720 [Saprospiraceae bacterium]|nr:hypothetical protein [Saprospiraceae bacterium]